MPFVYTFPPNGQDIEFSSFATITRGKIEPGRAALTPGILAALNQFWAIKGSHFTQSHIAFFHTI